MKKFGISAALVGIALGAPCGAGAAYPVYSGYQSNALGAQMGVNYYPTNTQTMMQGGMVVPAQNQVIMANPNVAASPTRITGSLPKVGSNASAAGRQYYQPADFDRLADSGLYVGLSAGYSASVMGSMKSDYAGEDRSFLFPGAFKDAHYEKDTVIPMQVSVGAAINSDIRIDFSFLRYGGLSYPNRVETSTGDGGFALATVSGGAITANATMLNVYYNIDSYTGYIAGGSLRPYLGAGVGVSLNTIADYVVTDNGPYYELSDEDLFNPEIPDGKLSTVENINAYHNGGTAEQMAFMLEGGVTTDLSGGLKMDFYVRYANLGRIKTSGSIVLSQVEWYKDSNSPTGENQSQFPSIQHQTNWYESGRLSVVDVGVRLRLQF